MCLKVDDATATLDRAEKLRDTPFRQAVGPGELEIPAVRGLGGSLLYFVDPKSELGRLWDIDFTAPKEPQGNGGAGLTRSITSRSRCTTRKCCRGSCSTIRCST